MSNINKNLYEWVTSFSGCDGGNPTAKTWACGIEWGFSATEDVKDLDSFYKNYYQNELKEEINKGKFIFKNDFYDWKDSFTYPYGKNVAKLYTAIYSDMDIYEYENFINANIETHKNDLFKLNLYPIAFNSTDDSLWRKYKVQDTLGFPDKASFNAWCATNRFPVFAEKVNEHKPRLIICTGVTYLNDFYNCFIGQGDKSYITSFQLTDNSDTNKHPRTCYKVIKNNQTAMFVIPFFSGSYGLNSSTLIKKLAEEIKKTLAELPNN